MLRIALLAAVAVIALPSAAEAAVLTSVDNGTLTITGDAAADQIVVRVSSPTTLQVGTQSFDRTTFGKLAIRSGGGDDTVQIDGLLTETTTIDTGAGADTVLGGPAGELIETGDDGDQVAPGGGDDHVLLGAGDDTAFQDDGSDLIEGQAGIDRLLVAGSAEAEEFTLQAFAGKARVARDTAPGDDRHARRRDARRQRRRRAGPDRRRRPREVRRAPARRRPRRRRRRARPVQRAGHRRPRHPRGAARSATACWWTGCGRRSASATPAARTG